MLFCKVKLLRARQDKGRQRKTKKRCKETDRNRIRSQNHPQITHTYRNDDLVAMDDLVNGLRKLDGVGGFVHCHYSVRQSITSAAYWTSYSIKVGQGGDGPIVKNPLFITCHHLPAINSQVQCTVTPGAVL